MEYSLNIIYAEGDLDWLIGRAAWDYDYFTSPDGVNKIFYKNLEEAKEKTGLTTVKYLV